MQDNTPLTEQQKTFAEKHHNVIFKFMSLKKLAAGEWYGVVAIGYLKAVKRWLEREKLQKYAFSTIAFYIMRAEVTNERRKQRRRLKTISLDAATQYDITLGDVITNKNLIYVDYIKGEDMKITYNVNVPPRPLRSSKKCEERIAIEEFLKSNLFNMCFSYDSKQEAQKRYKVVRVIITTNKFIEFIKTCSIDNCIYIEKTEKFFEVAKQLKEKEQICTNT